MKTARTKAEELGKYFNWDHDSEQVREIERALIETRNEALEEAAKVCDLKFSHKQSLNVVDYDSYYEFCYFEKLEDTIRTIKEKEK